jgi:glycosyltransferase involved in cell wall biosynthesis
MYFGWDFTGYKKGYQRFDIIVSELRKAGHEVHVIGLKRIWNNKKQKIFGYFEQADSAINIIEPRWASMIDVIIDMLFIANFFEAIMFLILCLKIKPDVVIIQDEPVGFSFWFTIFSKMFKIKTFVDYQDLIVRLCSYPNKKGLSYNLGILINERIIPKNVKGLIVTTEFGKKYFSPVARKIFIIRELVVPEIYNNVSEEVKNQVISKFNINLKKYKILWVGRLHPRHLKSLVMLFRAVSEISFKEKIQIIIVGNGEQLSYLMSLGKTLSLDVVYTGYLTPTSKTLIALYKISDIGFMSGVDELFMHFVAGLKLSEYLAAGLPVIVPSLYGIKEVIKGNGVLYNPDDLDDLKQKIIFMLNTDLKEMSCASKEIAHKLLSPMAFRNILNDFINFLKCKENKIKVAFYYLLFITY